MIQIVSTAIILAQFGVFLLLVRSQRKLSAAHADVVKAKDERIEAQENLVKVQDQRLAVLEKLACCGCGHSLGRHDNPDSADGYGCRDCFCQAIHNLVDTIERPRRN